MRIFTTQTTRCNERAHTLCYIRDLTQRSYDDEGEDDAYWADKFIPVLLQNFGVIEIYLRCLFVQERAFAESYECVKFQ